MNIKNILVPVDFSAPSRLAVDHGVLLARKFRARLTLLHVIEALSPFADSFRIETAGAEKEQEEQALRTLSALLGPEDQDDLDLRILIKSGDIKNEIYAAIEEENADFVVLGTHGRGLLGRWLIGSVTEGVVRNVSVPVLTVCYRVAEPLNCRRMLFATDLSEGSREGFEFALDLARTMRSELVVLHVIENLSLTYGGVGLVQYVSEADTEDARAKLATLGVEGTQTNVRTETILVEGTAAEAILNASRDQAPDLILISIRRKGLLQRALLGTTAERVIRESKVPVLLFPVVVEERPEGTHSRKATTKG